MCSRCRRRRRNLIIGLLALFAAPVIAAAAPAELRVCADPNNLPFSNRRLEGFENKIAELVAKDLHEQVRYTWWAERRGFIRNTLKAGLCDVVMGLPEGFELALLTRPYYRSTYVFVTRRDRSLAIRSFDDPRLKTLRVGVQLVGNDATNTPPAHALTRRHIVGNVVGYTLYGDYSKESPPARIVDAVARGDVDVAVVWGPLAGYFARRSRVPLLWTPVEPPFDPPGLRFVFDIGVGVRRSDVARRDALDAVLVRRRAEIRRILTDYGIPMLPLEETRAAR